MFDPKLEKWIGVKSGRKIMLTSHGNREPAEDAPAVMVQACAYEGRSMVAASAPENTADEAITSLRLSLEAQARAIFGDD